MHPLTYSLCQKQVIGLVMWVTSLCAFPPLFQDKPLSLSQSGASVTTGFEVRIEKSYLLVIAFDFPSAEARNDDRIVGTTYNDACGRDDASIPLAQREAMGRPIPLHVLVRDRKSGFVVVDKTFNTLCVTSHTDVRKTRTVGSLALKAGTYTIEVRNPERQSGLDGVKTSLSLVAGQGK